MKNISRKILKEINNNQEELIDQSVHCLREDGVIIACQSNPHVVIKPLAKAAGLDIIIKSTAQKELIFVPAIITHSGYQETVKNNFYIEPNAQVTIIAGCGIYSNSHLPSQHDGIHNFYLGQKSQVTYIEQHFGGGSHQGQRFINPQTNITMAPHSHLVINTTQLKGVEKSVRNLTANLDQKAVLLIKERVLTTDKQITKMKYLINLNGKNSKVDLVSRSIAQGHSQQIFEMLINGNHQCYGHAECDAIVTQKGYVKALPGLAANHSAAELVHEAAIRKISGEELIKLQTLGLTEAEAEQKIIAGFLQ